MKKYIASLAILAAATFLAGSAHAQQAAGTAAQSTSQHSTAMKPNRAKLLQSVLAKLNLTEDQKTKIKAAVKENAKNAMELRKSVKAGTVTKADAKTKQKELHKALMDSIKGILTPDQVRQFTEMMKEEAKKAKDAKAGGEAAGTTKTGGN